MLIVFIIFVRKIYTIMKKEKNNMSEYQRDVQILIDEEDKRSFRQESRISSKRSFVISVISIFIAIISLIVSIFK